MGLFELIFISVGLAMDAFAVSICKGLNMRRMNNRHAGIIALFFGGFQALMPFFGWILGKQFERYITSIDHWIAFILLAAIGVNMIHEALGEDDGDSDDSGDHLDLKELLMLAIATSIDALAVGITFAFLQVNILPAVSLIGIITLVISFAGSYREHPVIARINMPAAIHLFIRNLCLSQLSYDSWKFPFPFLIYIKKANACKFSESDLNIRSFPL